MDKWEKVVEYSPGHLESHTQRLKVPGGWIYRYSDSYAHMGMVFVPDPDKVQEVRTRNFHGCGPW